MPSKSSILLALIGVILGGGGGGGGGEPEGVQSPSLFIILLLCECIYFSFTNLIILLLKKSVL